MNSLRLVSKSPPHFSVQILDLSIDLVDSLGYSDAAMLSETYKKALVGLVDAAKTERAKLRKHAVTLRSQLEETERAVSELDIQIEQLEEAASLRKPQTEASNEPLPLAGEKSFSNAVAFVLKRASRSLYPAEIRDRLQEFGYDSSEWKTDVVSSVHTVLKRFLASDPPKVKESGEARRKVYQWNWEQDARQD